MLSRFHTYTAFSCLFPHFVEATSTLTESFPVTSERSRLENFADNFKSVRQGAFVLKLHNFHLKVLLLSEEMKTSPHFQPHFPFSSLATLTSTGRFCDAADG